MALLRNVYLVVSTEKDKDAVMEALEEEWPREAQYPLSQTAILVKDRKRTTRAIAEKLGFWRHASLFTEAPGPYTGVVLHIPKMTIAGLADEALWEWLDKIGTAR